MVAAVDRTHESVAETLNESVAWFDSFFSDRRFLDEGVPESYFRLRGGVRVRQRHGTKFLGRFHASLVMPKTERRLRIILEGTGDEERTGLLRADATAAEFEGGEAEQGSLQALYDFVRRLDINVSLRAGARFHFPIDPFLKLRIRYARPLGTRSLVRLTQEGFVTVQEGFGETTRIDLERRLAPRTLLRWSTSGTLAESNAGYEWGSELSLFRQLTNRTAVTVEGGFSAQVEPVAVVTNYVARIRFRQNVFRPWLFYEVEPELSWPRDERGANPPTWGVTLLAELQFGSPRKSSSDTLPAGTPPSAPPTPEARPDQLPGPR